MSVTGLKKAEKMAERVYRTVKQIMSESRVRSDGQTINGLKEEVAKLRAENAVLARPFGGRLLVNELNSSQVADILMCSAVDVDASEIEEQTGMVVKSEVLIDTEGFDVCVKLSFAGEDVDPKQMPLPGVEESPPASLDDFPDKLPSASSDDVFGFSDDDMDDDSHKNPILT